MSDRLPIPQPGQDIVPDGWWRSAVVPWADEQDSTKVLRQAAARLAGLEAAYRTLNADTAELTKGRRYLEHRWGIILGPGKSGPQSSPASEDLHRMERSRFREMAWTSRDGEAVAVTDIVLTILEARSDGDTLSRAKVQRAIREVIAKERGADPADDFTVDDIEIRFGSFAGSDDAAVPSYVLRDLCGTVDAIITDPPYDAGFVPMFDDLGELAANLLTSDGVLAVMTGQVWLPQYLEHLSAWLEYRWIGAYLTHGPRTRIHTARVGTGWKPILIYQRPDAERDYLLDDVFKSHADDKRFHHWGQSETGVGALVERLSAPGALVVDPCLGGGTSALVCRDLGRRFVGCDVDANAVRTTKERLDG